VKLDKENVLEGEGKLRKIICGMIIVLLIVSVFSLVFNIQLVKAAGETIYIKADGSVDPPFAPIWNVGNVYYTFTANISAWIVVERDNIVVNGAGHVLEGAGTGNGITLTGRSNVTIKSITIRKFGYGIALSSSSGNKLYANKITNNTYGILLFSSSSNSMSANTITNNNDRGIYLSFSSGNSMSANTITNNNWDGIWLYSSSNSNSISANTVTNNNYNGIYLDSSSSNSISANIITNNGNIGIYLFFSSSNLICHNNFVGNTAQAETTSGYVNIWDDGYPSGGNYWSDYTGIDLYKGPNQNVPGTDEIGDTPCTINADNQDNYPLMNPWTAITNVASLVVRGSNNIIYYRTYSVTTDSWTDWTALPGATCDSPAAALCNNELHMVVRDISGSTLYHGYVNLATNAFSGWTLISGATPSTPTLTS
jgi:parallel beta-helix repeat protein